MPTDRKNNLENPYSSWDEYRLKKRHLELLATDPNYQSLVASKVMPGAMGAGSPGGQRFLSQASSTEVPGRSFGDVASDVGISLKRGVVQLGDAAIGLANIPTGGHAGRLLEDVTGYKSGELDESLASQYSEAQQAASQRVSDATGFLGTVGTALQNPSTIVHAVLESAPSMVGGGVIGRGLIKAAPKLSAWVAGAMGEGTIQAGSMAEEVRQQSDTGLITGKQAAQSIGSGIGTGAFGMMGARVAKRLGVGDIDTWLAGGSLTTKAAAEVGQPVLKTARAVTSRIIAGGISEGIFEELPQSMQEQVWMNAATDKPLGEGIGEAGAMGMLAGAAMGGGFSIFTQPKVMQDEKVPAAKDGQTATQTAKQSSGPSIEEMQLNQREAQQRKEAALKKAATNPEEQKIATEAQAEEAYWKAEKEAMMVQVFDRALRDDYVGTLTRYVENPELLRQLPETVQERFQTLLSESIQTDPTTVLTEKLVSDFLTRNQRAIDALSYELEEDFSVVANEFAELSPAEQERVIAREQSALALIRRQQKMAQAKPRLSLQEIEANAALERFAERINGHLPAFIDINERSQTDEKIDPDKAILFDHPLGGMILLQQ